MKLYYITTKDKTDIVCFESGFKEKRNKKLFYTHGTFFFTNYLDQALRYKEYLDRKEENEEEPIKLFIRTINT